MDQTIDIDPGPENGAQSETANSTKKSEPKGVKKNNYFPDVILRKPNKIDTGADKGVKEQKYSLLTLFVFADMRDHFFMFIGILSAVACGILVPFITKRLGSFLQLLLDNQYCKDKNMPMAEYVDKKKVEMDYDDDMEGNELYDARCTGRGFMNEVKKMMVQIINMGVAMWVGSYFFITCLNYAANRQAHRIRVGYLKSLLRQDMGWHDVKRRKDIASKITMRVDALKEGIGEKLGMIIFSISTFSFSLLLVCKHAWSVSIPFFGIIVAWAINVSVFCGYQTRYARLEMKDIHNAGYFVEEVLRKIRAVTDCCSHEKEFSRFKDLMQKCLKNAIKRITMNGLLGGIVFFETFALIAVNFWHTFKYREEIKEEAVQSPFDVVMLYFNFILGTLQFMHAAPYFDILTTANTSARSLFPVIFRNSNIDPLGERGMRPPQLENSVVFNNVTFTYPTRKVQVLTGLSFKISKGDTVGIVGPSGSGKSTILQLIQRLYDPDPNCGTIEVGNIDTTSINVGWLRERIGIVPQENTLCDLSILENIRFGRPDVTKDEVIIAAKKANAFDFIMKLPRRFETQIGEKGLKLSGGQKQRIAIARAIVGNPSILLLDDATSSLDGECETIVQETLEKARIGRTTIIVTKRLSSIKQVNKIIVLNKGRVQEEGTHSQLMELHGVYFNLYTKQQKFYKSSEKDLTLDSISEMPESFDSVNDDTTTVALDIEPDIESLVSDNEIIKEIAENKKEEHTKYPWKRIVGFLYPDLPFIFMGIAATFVAAGMAPTCAVLYGSALIQSNGTEAEIRVHKLWHNVTMHSAVVFVGGLAFFLKAYVFGVFIETLVVRLRKRLFYSLLKQDTSFYEQSHSTGSLCCLLFKDTFRIQAVGGSKGSSALQGTFAVIISLLLVTLKCNFIMGLIIAGFIIPMMIAVFFSMIRISDIVDKKENAHYLRASKLAVDALDNIKALASHGTEVSFQGFIQIELHQAYNFSLKKMHWRGIIVGFTQALQFFGCAVCVYFGGKFYFQEKIDKEEIFKIIFAVMSTLGIFGYTFLFTGDLHKALNAISRLMEVIERKPEISLDPSEGLTLVANIGNLYMKDVEFSYPTRSNINVLNKLIMSVKRGERVALVGPTGCGKSTVIKLIQRLHHLERGDMRVENANIDALNVPWLRSKIGIVDQDPNLFDRSIADNIKYGSLSQDVTLDQIIEAAKVANIHTWVASLPEGYDTMVGSGGVLLSVGQKQRIAIARALIRSPRIILMDEATSALDFENERAVWENLSTALVGKTCITMCHTVTNVSKFDQIFVMVHGHVVESGNHQQLWDLRGHYWAMWRANNNSKWQH